MMLLTAQLFSAAVTFAAERIIGFRSVQVERKCADGIVAGDAPQFASHENDIRCVGVRLEEGRGFLKYQIMIIESYGMFSKG